MYQVNPSKEARAHRAKILKEKRAKKRPAAASKDKKQPAVVIEAVSAKEARAHRAKILKEKRAKKQPAAKSTQRAKTPKKKQVPTDNLDDLPLAIRKIIAHPYKGKKKAPADNLDDLPLAIRKIIAHPYKGKKKAPADNLDDLPLAIRKIIAHPYKGKGGAKKQDPVPKKATQKQDPVPFPRNEPFPSTVTKKNGVEILYAGRESYKDKVSLTPLRHLIQQLLKLKDENWCVRDDTYISVGYVRGSIQDANALMVVKDGWGMGVGFASFVFQKRALVIDAICTHKSTKGVGKMLVRHAKKLAKHRGNKVVAVDATPMAASFYEHIGFRDVGMKGTKIFPIYRMELNV
jgi:GNAT superfamily N-acetyltransferase